MVYATTSLAYPKDYVFALRLIYIRHIYYYDVILLESSTFFSVISWLVTVTVTISYDVTDVWQYDHNVILTLTLSLKIKMKY